MHEAEKFGAVREALLKALKSERKSEAALPTLPEGMSPDNALLLQSNVTIIGATYYRNWYYRGLSSQKILFPHSYDRDCSVKTDHCLEKTNHDLCEMDYFYHYFCKGCLLLYHLVPYYHQYLYHCFY